jgi:hypothetical protein
VHRQLRPATKGTIVAEYFLLRYRLNDHDGYLVWFSDEADHDRILLDEMGKLLTFSDTDRAVIFADARHWQLNYEAPRLHNLDLIQEWLIQPLQEDISCIDFLSAWNLFTDASFSIFGNDFSCGNERTNHVYDKLFWGNNLPAVTPAGKSYQPIWTTDEIAELHRILTNGATII